jgi:hypothetical protein
MPAGRSVPGERCSHCLTSRASAPGAEAPPALALGCPVQIRHQPFPIWIDRRLCANRVIAMLPRIRQLCRDADIARRVIPSDADVASRDAPSVVQPGG